MNSTRFRLLLLLLACTSTAIVGAALTLQHYERLAPCPLCILQRYGFLWMGLFAFVAAALGPGSGARVMAGVGALGGFAGFAVAVKHVWVLYHPAISCGIDPVENFVNALPMAHWLPSVFYANGDCSAELPDILGLQIPVWSMLWLFTLATCLALFALRRVRRAAAWA